jgi:hypothetical protein
LRQLVKERAPAPMRRPVEAGEEKSPDPFGIRALQRTELGGTASKRSPHPDATGQAARAHPVPAGVGAS